MQTGPLSDQNKGLFFFLLCLQPGYGEGAVSLYVFLTLTELQIIHFPPTLV